MWETSLSTPDGPTSGNKVHGRGRGFWSVWSNYVLFLFLKISGGAFSLRTQLLSICIDQEKKRRGFATHAHAHKYEHTETQQKSGGFSTLALNRGKKTIRFLWSVPLPGIFLPTSKRPRSTPMLAAPALPEPPPRPRPGLTPPHPTRIFFFRCCCCCARRGFAVKFLVRAGGARRGMAEIYARLSESAQRGKSTHSPALVYVHVLLKTLPASAKR